MNEMKSRILKRSTWLAAVCCLCSQAVAAPKPSPESVKELTQKVAAFHTRMEVLVTAALRGEADGPPDGAPTDEERALAFTLQMVWFASLVGWAGGLHGQSSIVEQTRVAAELMLRGR